MQITALRLKAFKSFVEEEFRPDSGLTVLVGRNNSGKSSLIDAIKLLGEAGREGPVPARAFNERGGLARLGFGGMGPMDIQLEAGLEGQDLPKLADPAPEGRDALIVRLTSAAPQWHTFAGTGGRALIQMGAWQRYSGAEGWFDGEIAGQHLSRIYYLGPHRARPEDIVTARGETELQPDAGNILRVLNTLAASDPIMFSRVAQKTRELLPEVSHILAPLVVGQAQAQGVVREWGLGEYELFWSNIADGSRQIMALVTFLLATPADSVLLMEEPEVFLHPHAVLQVVNIMKAVAAADRKQIIFSTHSPVMVEACGLPSLRLVVRGSDGVSHIRDISDAKAIDTMLAEHGVLRSFMLTPRQPGVVPRFQLIVEGKDDGAVWEKWLNSKGIRAPDVVVLHLNGESQAAKQTAYLKFLRDTGFAENRFLLVVDGGRDPGAKAQRLSQTLDDEDFHVLSRNEIDDYLVDDAAIAAVLRVEKTQVSQVIKEVRGQGKPRLKTILGKLDHKSAGTEVKALIANAMHSLPAEIEGIVERIRSAVRST